MELRLKKTILSLLCGVILTISLLILVLIVDLNTSTEASSGIPLEVRTLFAWVFFWADFLIEDSNLLSFPANFIVYSTASYLAVSWLIKKGYLE